ncbi:MAG TPA: hypothetical protein VF572_00485 [Candidatus Saccharimonadales bacterium]|jgi:hypothetical protein
MEKTIPYSNINNGRTSYTLVAFLSDQTQTQLSGLLNALVSELHHELITLPTTTLHITLSEMYQFEQNDKLQILTSAQKDNEYIEKIANSLRNTDAFNVSFNTIHAKPASITISGDDDGSFHTIRTKLIKNLSATDKPLTPPRIIHSSISRYAKAIPLERIQDVTDKHSVNVIEQVRKFQLVRMNLHPNFEYEVIQTFELH